jgi:hypothetical protein
MNPINLHPAKPDIDHPSLFKEGPRVVKTRNEGGDHPTRAKHHTGEKQESDKKRNKTQPLMRHYGQINMIYPYLKAIQQQKR